MKEIPESLYRAFIGIMMVIITGVVSDTNKMTHKSHDDIIILQQQIMYKVNKDELMDLKIKLKNDEKAK